jgi:hypothetical protein
MTDVQSTGALVPQKKPGLLLATGIITIVICSIGLIFSLSGLIGWLIFGGVTQMMGTFRAFMGAHFEDLYDALMGIVLRYYPVTLSINLIYFLTLVSGLAGGIVLLLDKKWAIRLLQAYAIAALGILVFQFVWTWLYTREALVVMKNYLISEGVPRGAGGFMAGIADIAMYFGIIVGLLLGSPWPILVLVFTSRKSLREYLSKKDHG